MRLLLSLFVCAMMFVTNSVAEVTVLGTVQTIYDRSPKLRIRGAGFDAQDHDITLDLAAVGEASLRVDKDFMVTKDPQGEGLILKLLNLRRWVNLDKREPPVGLVLNAVYFASDPSKNLLPEPKIVAQVLLTPSVDSDDRVMYQTASSALTVSGEGFKGAKKVDLYFQPPLLNEIAYEVVTPFPLTRNQVQLRLRHGFKWRENPGPLRIVGVDTGGGPVKLNGDDGVLVANVNSDLESHSVFVEETSETQQVYFDHPEIKIKGRGFNPDETKLRFSNGIMGAGVNYTSKITETEITLKLQQGSTWRKNVENLPGFLTLLAVNNGGPDGWVPVGPMNSGKGKDIAAVFERPDVHSNNKKLYRTHTHEFHLEGKGFTRVLQPTKILFEPPLEENVDYKLKQIDRDDLEVTLMDGKAWRESPGPLKVKGINTLGTEHGWIYFANGEGVHVADVVDDVSGTKTGGIEISPTSTRVYASVLQREINIMGSGFKSGMKLNMDPPLLENVDYSMEVESSNSIKLSLLGGRKWSKQAGFLIVKSVSVNGEKFDLAEGEGIRVAVVYEDPVINSGTDNFHETQSKVISVDGSGFTNAADMKITVRPTTQGNYKILGVSDDTVRLQLKPDFDWLPGFLTLAGEGDKKIPLQVTRIDTGAGEVELDMPVTIGFVVKDREGVVCDDSCEFAFDGICDDGTETDYYYEYENYGYYLDDDQGGYYYVGDDAYDDEGEDDGDDDEDDGDDDEDDGDDGDDDEDDGDDDEDDGDDDEDDGDDDEDDGEYGEEYDDEEQGTKEGYYAYSYDDYYAADDAYTVSACLEGTDCTDCGGVDAIVDYSKAPAADSGIEACTNSCPYARDGICDDPRGANYCQLGTDCQDCGPVGADNFTRIDDDGWWDDDDDYWTFNDATFVDQAKGLSHNRHRVKVQQVDSAGPAAMFLIVLEGMVYAVGGIFAAIALYLGMRIYNDQSIPFLNAFNSEESVVRDLENAPVRKMAITPDVIRT